MALQTSDRIKETSTTTGTGALTLAGAVTGFRAFSAVCTSPSDTCYYALQAVDGNGAPTGDWETGLGTYSASNTLTRTTVISSSNSNSVVSLSSGTKQVWIDLIASRIAFPPDSQTFTGNGTWTKQPGMTYVKVTLIGGGGGGGGAYGGSAGTNRYGASGAGGGALTERIFLASDLGATESVVVGAGGTGGTGGSSSAGTAGTAGGTSSFGSYFSAYGGGRGTGTSSYVAGGGGGGSVGAGENGSATDVAGGLPATSVAVNGIGTQGAGCLQGSIGRNAEYGGGAGGGQIGGTACAGGSSIYGASGGGGGDGLGTSDLSTGPAAPGGKINSYSSGGGAAGGTGTGGNAGTAGANGDSTRCGAGGGGGAPNTSGTGGAGGAGGTAGGGGGGGGAGTSVGGAGGAGGRGEVRIYSW